ncbi:YezD family protein [Lederbergia citrea]|uniref:YezD family protein n=1 Tax=Lederbergia citrea TaxID=2833581 RepID=A0A942UMY2_9BACI|nr:YezD family protein [Lederbergia citrea]MBS4205365.1 YezD family protein [Lederbergia citrea]MBS4224320.1 YezD family protein [Lederbergia citrea]
MTTHDELTIDYIREELKNIDYGSIVITIHDGRITQIDKNEKKRFPIEKKPVKKK